MVGIFFEIRFGETWKRAALIGRPEGVLVLRLSPSAKILDQTAGVAAFAQVSVVDLLWCASVAGVRVYRGLTAKVVHEALVGGTDAAKHLAAIAPDLAGSWRDGLPVAEGGAGAIVRCTAAKNGASAAENRTATGRLIAGAARDTEDFSKESHS